nr:hypothetical protein [uncultured Draconibacterium sp.]
MIKTLKLLVFILASDCIVACTHNNNKKKNEVPAPLFFDPNYQGSCDPEIVWNKYGQQWSIYYTARRPMLENPGCKHLLGWLFQKV